MDDLLADFATHLSKSDAPDWLRLVRVSASSQAAALGLPPSVPKRGHGGGSERSQVGARGEAAIRSAAQSGARWRYTDVSALRKEHFRLVHAERASPQSLSSVLPSGALLRLIENEPRMVFCNGQYCGNLSSDADELAKSFDGLKVARLSEYHRATSKPICPYLEAEYRDPFLALNTAYLNDGALIDVRSEATIKRPVWILHILKDDMTARPLMHHPRTVLFAGKRASVTINEVFISLSMKQSFTNAVSQCYAQPEANVTRRQFQWDLSDHGVNILRSSVHLATDLGVRQRRTALLRSGRSGGSASLQQNRLGTVGLRAGEEYVVVPTPDSIVSRKKKKKKASLSVWDDDGPKEPSAPSKRTKFQSFQVCLSGELSFSSTEVFMHDSGCDAIVDGVSVLSGLQHMHARVFVHHEEPDCSSDQRLKLIAAESSCGVFEGRVRIDQDAQKSSAVQSCKSLLLSDESSVIAKPELIILADDVKCSHGATVGELDDALIFYLMSRGIPERKARAILMFAFVEDVLSSALEGEPAVRSWLADHIRQQVDASARAVERLTDIQSPVPYGALFPGDEAASPRLMPQHSGTAPSGHRRSTASEQVDVVPYNPIIIRQQFPILLRTVHGGKPLVYLDNAASTQKPDTVLEAENNMNRSVYSNVHRGLHELSEKSSEMVDEARSVVQNFINAPEADEVIFTSGTTDSINLLAFSLGQRLSKGDEIVVTMMEHHSNIVPWQELCLRAGCTLHVVPLTPENDLDLVVFESLLSARTAVVAVAHVSNVLGTINPIHELAVSAHSANPTCVVIVDGAQAVAHLPVDVQALECDAYAFSGHKMYGPNGIGVLWGRRSLLESLPPYRTGGGQISVVSFTTPTTFAAIPFRFEAGTPHIPGIVGLRAAVEFLQGIGLENIESFEQKFTSYTVNRLSNVAGLSVIGSPKRRAGVISFVMDAMHAHDIGTLLDLRGFAVRAGHHCAMPLHNALGLESSARIALGLYNTTQEIDGLVAALQSLGTDERELALDNTLYQELLLDHNKHPQNWGPLHPPRFTNRKEGYNRLCGDKYTVDVYIVDGIIEDIGVYGSGCAISKASSSLMTTIVKGLSISDALVKVSLFVDWLLSQKSQKEDRERLFAQLNSPKLVIFKDVHLYPARVKCATLSWHTVKVALELSKNA